MWVAGEGGRRREVAGNRGRRTHLEEETRDVDATQKVPARVAAQIKDKRLRAAHGIAGRTRGTNAGRSEARRAQGWVWRPGL